MPANAGMHPVRFELFPEDLAGFFLDRLCWKAGQDGRQEHIAPTRAGYWHEHCLGECPMQHKLTRPTPDTRKTELVHSLPYIQAFAKDHKFQVEELHSSEHIFCQLL